MKSPMPYEMSEENQKMSSALEGVGRLQQKPGVLRRVGRPQLEGQDLFQHEDDEGTAALGESYR